MHKPNYFIEFNLKGHTCCFQYCQRHSSILHHCGPNVEPNHIYPQCLFHSRETVFLFNKKTTANKQTDKHTHKKLLMYLLNVNVSKEPQQCKSGPVCILPGALKVRQLNGIQPPVSIIYASLLHVKTWGGPTVTLCQGSHG